MECLAPHPGQSQGQLQELTDVGFEAMGEARGTWKARTTEALKPSRDSGRQTDGWTPELTGARNSAAAHQGPLIILALKPPPQPRTLPEPGKVSDGPYKEKWDPLTRPPQRQTIEKRPLPRAMGHRVLKEPTPVSMHLGKPRPRANAWPTAPDCPLTRPGCVSAPLICRPPGPQGQGGRTARGRGPVLTFLGSHRKLSTTKSHPSSLPERGRAWAEGT
uniref:Uncharacterized protein n=1 Tax=Myotis myotis TaxID=51298 RepID=A0A7J7S285_MYOMY|nr:hypothetical protein mMyoMyo1_010032 [Myotis myotis]